MSLDVCVCVGGCWNVGMLVVFINQPTNQEHFKKRGRGSGKGFV